MRVPIVVLGSDLAEEGAKIGWETKIHCKKAIELYKHFKGYIIMSPGIAPEGFPRQKKPMAEMMADYLLTEASISAKDICVLSPVWGTRAEVRAAWEHIGSNPSLYSGPGEVTRWNYIDHTNIVMKPRFICSWYHAPRVRFIARAERPGFSSPDLASVEFEVITTEGRCLNAVYELYKYPGEIFLRLVGRV